MSSSSFEYSTKMKGLTTNRQDDAPSGSSRPRSLYKKKGGDRTIFGAGESKVEMFRGGHSEKERRNTNKSGFMKWFVS